MERRWISVISLKSHNKGVGLLQLMMVSIIPRNTAFVEHIGPDIEKLVDEKFKLSGRIFDLGPRYLDTSAAISSRTG
jgi:hypothetical protein